ncbi:MAG TPA: hypothetical protein VL866_06320 [Pyrinomonadaceae bacterium]|nr:hypothetical protein [Pyrinomonadaceae bacterium]
MTRVAVVLILLLGLSASAQTTRAPEKWVKYEFDNGAISILSPLKLNAVEAVIPAELPLAKTVTATGADAGRVFTVTFSILKTNSNAWTASERELFYLGIWQGLEASLKDTLSKQNLTWTIQLDEMKAVTIGARTGRQIGYSFGPYKGTVRALLIGNRSYAVSILCLPELHAQLSVRYFDSFTVTPTAAAKAQG